MSKFFPFLLFFLFSYIQLYFFSEKQVYIYRFYKEMSQKISPMDRRYCYSNKNYLLALNRRNNQKMLRQEPLGTLTKKNTTGQKHKGNFSVHPLSQAAEQDEKRQQPTAIDQVQKIQGKPRSARYDKYLKKSRTNIQPPKFLHDQYKKVEDKKKLLTQTMSKQQDLQQNISPQKNNSEQFFEEIVRKCLKDKYNIEGEQQAVTFLKSHFNQYELKYNEQQNKDFWELGYLVCEVLRYPSTPLAQKHRMAKKLGKFDLDDPEDLNYCPCCGLIIQEELLDIFTDPEKIKNVGSFTSLYFATIKSLILLLCILFAFFGLSSTITNIASSKQYNQQINNPKFSLNILQMISLQAKQSSRKGKAEWSLTLQSWNGVLAVIVFGLCFGIMKWVEFKTELGADDNTRSISDYSILFKNLQIVNEKEIKDNLELPKILKILNPKIEIVKINYAIPFNINQETLPSKKLCDAIDKKYTEEKKTFMSWVQMRRENQQFPEVLDQRARYQAYSKFEQMRSQRYQSHQTYTDEFQKEIEHQQRQILRADAFVTFDSVKSKRQVQKYFEENNNLLYEFEIEAAFEPLDIKWRNFGQERFEKYARKLLTFSVTIVILSVSCFCLYNLQNFNEHVSQNFKQTKGEVVLRIVVSILLSLPIILTNFILKKILLFLTKKERNTSHTHEQTSIGYKVLFATLVNSIIVPTLIQYSRDRNFYGENGLAENVFYFAITNAVIGVGMKILNPDLLLNWLAVKWASLRFNKVKTLQLSFNVAYEDIKFYIGLEYSSVIFIFLYTCFFSSMQPVIILFGILGLGCSYWAYKVMLFYYCKRPRPCHSELNQIMYQLIFAGPLFYSVGSFLFTDYLSEKPGANRAASIISIILSITILIVPYSFLRKYIVHVDNPDYDQYESNKLFLPCEYDRVNPFTSKNAVAKFQEFKAIAIANRKSDILLKDKGKLNFHKLFQGQLFSMQFAEQKQEKITKLRYVYDID